MARVNAGDMTNEFASESHTYRGVTYTIHELAMSDYDKTVKLATTKDELTGEDKFDSVAHNKILTAKCVRVNGKPVDPDDLYSRGTRLVRQLQRIVQKLHWDEEPEEEAETGEATAEASQ